jgi:hypothetical protein
MIPRSVVVNKMRYRVHIGPPNRFKAALGYIDYTPGDIYIHSENGKPLSEAKMQETFWHELTHAILYEMDHPLYRSEVFVTRFAQLLNKAINSAEL